MDNETIAKIILTFAATAIGYKFGETMIPNQREGVEFLPFIAATLTPFLWVFAYKFNRGVHFKEKVPTRGTEMLEGCTNNIGKALSVVLTSIAGATLGIAANGILPAIMERISLGM